MADETRPDIDEVLAFRHALSDEADRGCALMAGAYLDDQLERLLRCLFVDDAETADTLLGPSGPLATFASRIDLSYLLGLISDKTRRDLDLIRKIRNEFAHTASRLTFEDQRVANRCAELRHSFQTREARSRAKFTNAAMGACGAIHSGLGTIQRCEKPPDDVLSDQEEESLGRTVRQVMGFEELQVDEADGGYGEPADA